MEACIETLDNTSKDNHDDSKTFVTQHSLKESSVIILVKAGSKSTKSSPKIEYKNYKKI